MGCRAAVLLALMLPWAVQAVVDSHSLRVEGMKCSYYVDRVLFPAAGLDCPVHSTLTTIEGLPSYKSCCRECAARMKAAGGACHSFAWHSASLACMLYVDEPDNSKSCGMRNQTGTVSGQYWPGQGWPGAAGSTTPADYLPRGKARLHFPLRASGRQDMHLSRRSRGQWFLLGNPLGLAPEEGMLAGVLPAPAPAPVIKALVASAPPAYGKLPRI